MLGKDSFNLVICPCKTTLLPAPALWIKVNAMSDPICPLCKRVIPPDVPQSRHHLIPKLKGGGGGPVVLLHHICHREVHATLSEADLAKRFNTVEALRAHPRLAKFFAWVGKRPPGFSSRVPGGTRKR